MTARVVKAMIRPPVPSLLARSLARTQHRNLQADLIQNAKTLGYPLWSAHKVPPILLASSRQPLVSLYVSDMDIYKVAYQARGEV